MTDVVKLAMIAALPPTIASLATLIATFKGIKKVEKLDRGINGLKDELVQTTKAAAFQAGIKQEKEHPS